ncbi:MAG: LacI family DNA-binding transcriptional regulator [Actinomycetota bacterium]|nr:LacI family DNA-binding transcriptional regulator [Actinomycetota bacterium]
MTVILRCCATNVRRVRRVVERRAPSQWPCAPQLVRSRLTRGTRGPENVFHARARRLTRDRAHVKVGAGGGWTSPWRRGVEERGNVWAARTPTIRDVARRAGVSVATVSRALRGSRPVRPDLAVLVHRAAEELGYRPNALAQGLRLRSSGTVGMIVPSIANPFFASCAEAVEKELEISGRTLLLSVSGNDPDLETRRLHGLIERRIDGLVIVPCDSKRSRTVLATVEDRVPIVQLDRRVDDFDSARVGVDDEVGIKLVLQHLAERGASTVFFISARADSSTAFRRLSAFRQIAERLRLRSIAEVALGEFTSDWGREAAIQLLSGDDLPDAVVCGDDAIAFGVLQACHEAGVRVPSDLMVTGYDDVSFSAVSHPPLTTVRQPIAELARLSIGLLDRQRELGSHAAETFTLQPSLVVRASTRSAAGSSLPVGSTAERDNVRIENAPFRSR